LLREKDLSLKNFKFNVSCCRFSPTSRNSKAPFQQQPSSLPEQKHSNAIRLRLQNLSGKVFSFDRTVLSTGHILNPLYRMEDKYLFAQISGII
jgi:hypothetical protein